MPTKLRFILLVLFCFGTNANAQSYLSNSKNRFSFGFNFSPDYTYRTLRSEVDGGDEFIKMRNDMEAARFGFTTGLVVKYQLNKFLAFESGLQYADRGDKTESDDPGYVFPDEGDPFIPDESKTVYHYYFLGVPLKANFYVLNKRTKVFLSAGVSADFFSGSKTKQIYYYNGEKEANSFSEENVDFNNINLMGLAGLGLEYKLNKKLELRLEPIARYSFSSLTTYSDIKTHLYSIGANFTVFIHK